MVSHLQKANLMENLLETGHEFNRDIKFICPLIIGELIGGYLMRPAPSDVKLTWDK